MYDELCCKWHQTFYHWKITTNRRYILAIVFLKFKYQRTKQKSTIDLESTKLTEVGITDIIRQLNLFWWHQTQYLSDDFKKPIIW